MTCKSPSCNNYFYRTIGPCGKRTGKVYCSSRCCNRDRSSEAKDRERLTNRIRRYAAMGRMCHFCLKTDSERAGFNAEDICEACARLLQRGRVCLDCGGPKRHGKPCTIYETREPLPGESCKDHYPVQLERFRGKYQSRYNRFFCAYCGLKNESTNKAKRFCRRICRSKFKRWRKEQRSAESND